MTTYRTTTGTWYAHVVHISMHIVGVFVLDVGTYGSALVQVPPQRNTACKQGSFCGSCWFMNGNQVTTIPIEDEYRYQVLPFLKAAQPTATTRQGYVGLLVLTTSMYLL